MNHCCGVENIGVSLALTNSFDSFGHFLMYRSQQFLLFFLNILLYGAFYRDGAEAFPMTLQAVVSYMWLRQAFLTLFETWSTEGDLLEAITHGNVAYELTRPIGLYNMWYTRVLSGRVSKMLLRALPLLLVAFLIPAPYGMGLPVSLTGFGGFLLTLVTGYQKK